MLVSWTSEAVAVRAYEVPDDAESAYSRMYQFPGAAEGASTCWFADERFE
jgi:hypothetical protein